ncbi:MAG: hypothetical protein ACLUE1_00055 [Adlercreutzia equolifaciens]
MATMMLSRLRQARYAILGFGCNQAFLFAILYLGSYNESSQHGFLIDRADLLCVLLVMAATFALMTRERRRRHLMVVAEGLVRCYALPLVGALYLIVALHSLAPGIPWLALAAVEGLAAGVPLALLLCRWGRVLGEASIDQSVPEVFIGSALGAAVCFFVVAIPVEGAYILLYVLPVGSAWALRALGEPDDRDAEPAAAGDPTEEAAKLSGRIIAGTVVYGLATGAVEALATSAEGEPRHRFPSPSCSFVLYCVAALQLYGVVRSVGVRAVLPTGPIRRWGRSAARTGSPSCSWWAVSWRAAAGERERLGVAVVLAGYLGSSRCSSRCSSSWAALAAGTAARLSARAAALFAGEITGVLVGGVLGALPGAFDVSAALVAWPAWRCCTRICSCSLTATWQRSRWSSPRATVSRRPAISSRARRSFEARGRDLAARSARPHRRAHRRRVLHLEEHRLIRICAASTPSATCIPVRSSSTWASARKRS